MCVVQKDSPQTTPQNRGTDAEGWERQERLNKSEAEKLLDWLETNGYSQREVALAEDGSFTVRWRR
ncbi:MAG TPA: hypothetical protein VMF69_23960 [Gemmataceae bacterium]|nr:hypothetical protein [Gemmataceae bacterium]